MERAHDNQLFRCKFLAMKKYLEMERHQHVPYETLIRVNPENDVALFVALSFENLMMKKRLGGCGFKDLGIFKILKWKTSAYLK